MKQNLLKTLIVTLITFTGLSLKAQDIIIKTDKTEIKAKVLEIEENSIKYKKFDFVDGPSYNINKAQVFMIIYKNGTRETFENSKPIANTTKPAETREVSTLFAKTADTAAVVNETKATDAVDAAKSSRVDYFPSRLWGSFSSLGGLSLAVESEYGLLPNYINSGLGVTASVFESDYASSFGYGATIYASGYLPINKMTGNIENQNKGFFPFVRLGGTFSMVDVETDSGETFSSSSFGVSHGVGADYKFSSKFGLSVFLAQFNSLGYGINFKF